MDGTPWDWLSIVLVGPALRINAQVEFRGLGIGVRTRCASGSGRAMRCVVIGRDIRGTVQVVNESGSAVLAASLEMACLDSPADA